MTDDAAVPGTDEVAQGSLELLRTSVAQRLLRSRIPARIAYVAPDGTPRVFPTWFEWNGQALVTAAFVRTPGTGRGAGRVGALRANPAVAVTIDTLDPTEVLLLRGRVEIAEVDGIVPEYASCARRYLGADAGAAYIASMDKPGARMARISLRPSWVGVVDFGARMPGPLDTSRG
jgi:hypothetical protein